MISEVLKFSALYRFLSGFMEQIRDHVIEKTHLESVWILEVNDEFGKNDRSHYP
jgi:hypothetical protein